MMPARPPVLRASLALPGELVVDNFAGGGGASAGIERALGRPVDVAINHSPQALAMHKANHPSTKHFCENICEVDPREVCGSQPVGLAWFSPDCTHFSRAKGTQPLKKEIRGLAWVVIRWAKTVAPRIIVLENVEEFQSWGPLGVDGRPERAAQGATFRQWLAALRSLGYELEFRSLVAADYGAPTTRRRLFLIARRDSAPIVWPAATHGRGRAEPWRGASEIIDWSLPTPSIFERKKPLAEATLKRIALGIERYVVRAATPFLIGAGGPIYAGKPVSLQKPLGTVVAENHRSLVSPFVVRHGHYSTLSGAGLHEGCGAGTFRGQSLAQPVGTVCATNDKHLVAPLVTKHYGGVVGHGVGHVLGTVTSRDHHALSAAFLTKFYGTSVGARISEPVPTVTANNRGGGHLAQVQALLQKYSEGRATTQLEPLFARIQSGAEYTEPRRGIVTIDGDAYQIVDIGTRMLQPRELFRAQGFDDTYVIDPIHNGKPLTKTAQIALAGNSVCPQVAAAIVAANVANAALSEVAS